MPIDKQSIDWYNQHAEEYAKHVRDPAESVYHSLYEKPAMFELLPDLQDKQVLSLGCGPGEDSAALKGHGAERSVGIDISEANIALAQEHHPDCEFSVMDMEQLDFPDASFDLVYSSIAINYLETWDRVFSEAYRVLRPGGTFLFSTGHPLYTAMSVREIESGKKVRELTLLKDKNRHEIELSGEYLTRHKNVGGGDMDVTTWHKSLGEIAGEISQAGFVIDRIVEPKPLEGMKELAPMSYESLSKIPFFIIFRLKKLAFHD